MPGTRLRVGVYINSTRATTLRFLRCLQAWDMDFVSIWRDDLAALRPGQVDVLLLHGGWYGIDRQPAQEQDDRIATPEHEAMATAVRQYVQAGGGLVGVCCGAFNVVWLGLIEARISRTAGVGMHSLEVRQAAHPLAAGVVQPATGRTDRAWLAVPVLRMNGPIFFPADPATQVFSYDWEHRLGAVLAADCGQGRAVAISPHPERSEHDLTEAMPDEPLMPVARLLRNALLWSAHREVE